MAGNLVVKIHRGFAVFHSVKSGDFLLGIKLAAYMLRIININLKVMLHKILMYGMLVGKLSQLGLGKAQVAKNLYMIGKRLDKRLLYLLLVPPAILVTRFAVNRTKKKPVKHLGESLLGLAGARLALAGLRMKMKLQGQS
jgi:hypothetical protein